LLSASHCRIIAEKGEINVQLMTVLPTPTYILELIHGNLTRHIR